METNNQSAPEYLFDRVKELVRGWNEVSDKAGTLVREATQGVHDRFAPRNVCCVENNVAVGGAEQVKGCLCSYTIN